MFIQANYCETCEEKKRSNIFSEESNGITLILSTTNEGKIFEITKEGNVWFNLNGAYKVVESEKELALAFAEALKVAILNNEETSKKLTQQREDLIAEIENKCRAKEKETDNQITAIQKISNNTAIDMVLDIIKNYNKE